MHRRQFIQAAVATAVGAALPGRTRVVGAVARTPAPTEQEVTAAKLPRWRGFNLLEKFIAPRSGRSLPVRSHGNVIISTCESLAPAAEVTSIKACETTFVCPSMKKSDPLRFTPLKM